MKYTAGIHFTPTFIRIVIMNRLDTVEMLKVSNNADGFFCLKAFLKEKYPPASLVALIDGEQFNKELLPKILLKKGYQVRIINSAIHKEPLFGLLRRLPKMQGFHLPFLKAATAKISLWQSFVSPLNVQKKDPRQIEMFEHDNSFKPLP